MTLHFFLALSIELQIKPQSEKYEGEKKIAKGIIFLIQHMARCQEKILISQIRRKYIVALKHLLIHHVFERERFR